MMSSDRLGTPPPPPPPSLLLRLRLAFENRDDSKDFILLVSTLCSQCLSRPQGDNVQTVMMSPCWLGIPTIPAPLPPPKVGFRDRNKGKEFVLSVKTQCSQSLSRSWEDSVQTVMMSPCWLGIPTLPTPLPPPEFGFRELRGREGFCSSS
jgi:hypothetical protein